MNHDAISVQLCLSAGLSESETDILLKRIKGHPSRGEPIGVLSADELDRIRMGVDAILRPAKPGRLSGKVSALPDRDDDVLVYLAPGVPSDYTLTLIERSYDQRANAIIAFNTCAGDLDDKLDAAYKATLRHSPTPTPEGQQDGML